MITNGFTYLAVLIFLAGLLKFCEARTRHRIFDYAPAIVILYLAIMLLSSLGLWQQSDSVNSVYQSVKTNLLSAMIFLMLLKSDLRRIKMLGPKMLIGFFSASISIGIGFVITFALFQTWLEHDSWKTFAALSGSWMGGTGNMTAIQGALNIPDSRMGYALLIDSIDYAIWVVFLLALVPYSATFNKWVGTNSEILDKIGSELANSDKNAPTRSVDLGDLLLLLGLALVVSSGSQFISQLLPASSFFTATTWSVLLTTVLGVACAMTALGRIPGSSRLSNLMLYIIVALIASRANFAELTQAPIYIAAGFLILLIHGLCMVVAARIFKLDLFTCGLASLANIGGVASAPILAAAYSEVLIPIGVLMAMLGYIVGTGGGLLVGKFMSMLVMGA